MPPSSLWLRTRSRGRRTRRRSSCAPSRRPRGWPPSSGRCRLLPPPDSITPAKMAMPAAAVTASAARQLTLRCAGVSVLCRREYVTTSGCVRVNSAPAARMKASHVKAAGHAKAQRSHVQQCTAVILISLAHSVVSLSGRWSALLRELEAERGRSGSLAAALKSAKAAAVRAHFAHQSHPTRPRRPGSQLPAVQKRGPSLERMMEAACCVSAYFTTARRRALSSRSSLHCGNGRQSSALSSKPHDSSTISSIISSSYHRNSISMGTGQRRMQVLTDPAFPLLMEARARAGVGAHAMSMSLILSVDASDQDRGTPCMIESASPAQGRRRCGRRTCPSLSAKTPWRPAQTRQATQVVLLRHFPAPSSLL